MIWQEWFRDQFLSTPSARRATLVLHGADVVQPISIHALREEGDKSASVKPPWPILFLSTPSARRATGQECAGTDRQRISIHALREEGDAWAMWSSQQQNDFYPRPPRGGRQVLPADTAKINLFLSTPSARRATSKCLPTPRRKPNFYPRPPRGGRR